MHFISATFLTLLILLSPPLTAQDVTVGFSKQFAPYIFTEDDRGLEIDVLREALAYRNHRLIPSYYSFEQLPLAFRYNRIDAARLDTAGAKSNPAIFYADPAVTYDNVLITRADRNIKITNAKNLANHVVVSFPGAQNRFASIIDAARSEGLYFETDDQELQVLGLYREKFDVMLADRYVFDYLAKKIEHEQGVRFDVRAHALPSLNPYQFNYAFHDQQLRDDYAAGLEHLKETGRLQEIYAHYLDSPFTP